MWLCCQASCWHAREFISSPSAPCRRSLSFLEDRLCPALGVPRPMQAWAVCTRTFAATGALPCSQLQSKGDEFGSLSSFRLKDLQAVYCVRRRRRAEDKALGRLSLPDHVRFLTIVTCFGHFLSALSVFHCVPLFHVLAVYKAESFASPRFPSASGRPWTASTCRRLKNPFTFTLLVQLAAGEDDILEIVDSGVVEPAALPRALAFQRNFGTRSLRCCLESLCARYPRKGRLAQDVARDQKMAPCA